MPISVFNPSVLLPVSAADAWAWHARPGAFQRLTPPWEPVRVASMTGPGGIQTGTQVELELRFGPARLRWLAEHRDCEPGVLFRDVQVRGPFAHWDHRHHFASGSSTDTCLLEDRVEYSLPLGKLGGVAGGAIVRRKLARMFRYRHAVTQADLRDFARWRSRPRLRVLVTGSTGLIGSALVATLATCGHTVARVVRPGSRRAALPPANADPASVLVETRADGLLDQSALADFAPDAVVHLAGEPVAAGRWSTARMRRIWESRVDGTRRLSEQLATLPSPPRILVSASATGYYGDGGPTQLDERSARGDGFLAELCEAWESASESMDAVGARRVHLRIGFVLSPLGGALRSMLWPFRLGLGGAIAPGTQHVPWITLDDCVAAIHHALMHDSIAGPGNVVAPNPVPMCVFARTLGRVLRRPALLPVPTLALRLRFGPELARSTRWSTNVHPGVLLESGYEFRHAALEEGLRHLLGR